MKTKKVKAQNKNSSFRLKTRSIRAKGTWKAVEIDPSVFSEQGLEGLVCFEELRDYRLIDSEKAAAKQLQREKKVAKKRKVAEEDEAGETPAEPAKKKAKKKKGNKKVAPKESVESESGDATGEDKAVDKEAGKDEISEDLGEQEHPPKREKIRKKKMKNDSEKDPVTEEQPKLDSPSETKGLNKGQNKTKPIKKQTKNWTSAALCGSDDDKQSDVSAWKDLFVPSSVLMALSSLGFESPTPIQALALPPAIRDHMDVLGAAETGSGKTLAFGIPMIHAILEWKSGTEQSLHDNIDKTPPKVASLYLPSVEESAKSEDESTAEGNQEGSVEASDEEDSSAEDGSEDQDEKTGSVCTVKNAERCVEEQLAGGRSRPLLGMVLTPTRELAVQVKHHIDAVTKFTDIKTAILVGGMAQQKQKRMLKRCPEIIIATPGRLWDLIKEKHPHLLNLRHLRCLVIDEADRMVERGHFAELESLLEMLNTTHFNPKRQTFVFSATLTLTHSLPSRLLQKKKNLEKRSKLDILIEKVGIKSKPKVIDLTRKEATVETLTETQIHCQKDEKDFYLYYFLLQYPGRTMVFANSIDCIKRLNSLLVILECNPLPLHANMHQKQRLKNLERFAERESGVLLTTDVAARGLDIPDVQHVIHYQVPRTSETYVHRSGRTARATKEGLSLLLVGPDDMINLKKIYKTLEKDEESPMFPIETKCLEAIKERVNLARKIEKIEFYNSREKHHDSWFKQAAEALEVDLDDDLLLGGAKDEDEEREQQKKVKGMKRHLKHLISQPIFKHAMKTRYPTQMGKLPLAHMPHATMESALTRVSNEKKNQKAKRGFSQPCKQRRGKEKQ
uniref:ATP-dependent RNA helicase n=1 Tax=Oryzias latipes TaxID=8090 RepID=A0A3P9KHT7_ORYLA